VGPRNRQLGTAGTERVRHRAIGHPEPDHRARGGQDPRSLQPPTGRHLRALMS